MSPRVGRKSLLRRVVDVVSISVVGIAGLLVLGRVTAGALARLHDRQAGSLRPAAFARAISSGHWLGSRDAPAVLLVYSDYTCGFCAELHETLKELRRRYPMHLAVVVKAFAEPSFHATYKVPLGAECANEQNRFLEYHEAAFANGRILSYSRGWRALADSAQVPDLAEFELCVQSQRYIDKLVSDYEEAESFGVSATPTMFVNGSAVVGAVPMAVLDSMIAGQFRARSKR